RGLSEPIEGYSRVTPAMIIESLAGIVDGLGLPHPLHLHCNNLGMPGNAATAVAEYFNAHPGFTADAGAVLFGNAMTITADGPWQHLLHELTGRKWGN